MIAEIGSIESQVALLPAKASMRPRSYDRGNKLRTGHRIEASKAAILDRGNNLPTTW